ncbi:hypothetical protein OUZ56_021474 [Daphnia magna]|uniref:Uncharacterized protein n=1 Tax=Daphnia magna TaxID=35525 RepID=A0ABQ9ZHG5_9CRUS|nr:hypothetical protein OUZ56_021474 [Daphnia magna]
MATLVLDSETWRRRFVGVGVKSSSFLGIPKNRNQESGFLFEKKSRVIDSQIRQEINSSTWYGIALDLARKIKSNPN